MAEKMVLSTPLLIAYENMGQDPRQYQKKYKRLMKVLALPYKTNKRQLDEAKEQGLNEAVYDRLIPQLQHSSDRDACLKTLAANTSFKVILTEDKNLTLPYVDYRASFLKNQLSISLKASDSRSTLIPYLEQLCSSASKVTICDNYFAQNWDNTQSLFRAVLPRHKLEIEFVETPDAVGVIKNSTKMTDDFVKSIHPDWSIQASEHYADLHDRYLLIKSPQGKLEVMISSGFDHIWKKSNPKEITCVIREVENE
ncbi:MAG: hypothetical protein D3905_03830 [Candidatus Electrothrix sp. AS4_5]|nr:hypothetical protein [Candidatus Electrothrix gigas]